SLATLHSSPASTSIHRPHGIPLAGQLPCLVPTRACPTVQDRSAQGHCFRELVHHMLQLLRIQLLRDGNAFRNPKLSLGLSVYHDFVVDRWISGNRNLLVCLSYLKFSLRTGFGTSSRLRHPTTHRPFHRFALLRRHVLHRVFHGLGRLLHGAFHLLGVFLYIGGHVRAFRVIHLAECFRIQVHNEGRLRLPVRAQHYRLHLVCLKHELLFACVTAAFFSLINNPPRRRLAGPAQDAQDTPCKTL